VTIYSVGALEILTYNNNKIKNTAHNKHLYCTHIIRPIYTKHRT